MDYRKSAYERSGQAYSFMSAGFRRAIRHIEKYLQQRRAEKKKQNPADRAASSTARATWAIAVLTFVTIGVGISQYIIFSRQLDEMRATGAQTDKLIETNKKLSEAAIRQADTAEIAQRAWLAPMQFSFVNLNYAAEPLRVRMMYQNVGREPARGVRNRLNSGYIRKPVPSDVSEWAKNPIWHADAMFDPHKMCAKAQAEAQSVIYPSATIVQSVEIIRGAESQVTAEEIPVLFNEVKNRSSIFFVMGCLSYETLGHRRNTSFCAYLRPSPDKEIGDWAFAACPVGNDDF